MCVGSPLTSFPVYLMGGHLPDGVVIKTPRRIAALQGVTVATIAAGGSHSAVVDHKGTLWMFGSNSHGCLCLGDYRGRLVPECVPGLPSVRTVALGVDHTCIVTRDGAVWTAGAGVSGCLGHGDGMALVRPRCVAAIEGVVAVGAGEGHTVVVDAHGYCWACGDGSQGAVGTGFKHFVPIFEKVVDCGKPDRGSLLEPVQRPSERAAPLSSFERYLR